METREKRGLIIAALCKLALQEGPPAKSGAGGQKP
jgi:hypothetical protein